MHLTNSWVSVSKSGMHLRQDNLQGCSPFGQQKSIPRMPIIWSTEEHSNDAHHLVNRRAFQGCPPFGQQNFMILILLKEKFLKDTRHLVNWRVWPFFKGAHHLVNRKAWSFFKDAHHLVNRRVWPFFKVDFLWKYFCQCGYHRLVFCCSQLLWDWCWPYFTYRTSCSSSSLSCTS